MTTPGDRSSPIRTCVGCRERRPQQAMVRCVLDADGRARLDRHGPGRGAWLCGPGCLEPAIRRGSFRRAWRTSLAADALDRVADELSRLGDASGGEPPVACETDTTTKG